MNKVIIIFIMMLVLGCGFSSASLACYETFRDIPQKSKEEVMPQAYAIGMFKVVGLEDGLVTYKTIAAYNQFVEKEITVKLPPPSEIVPCSPSLPVHKDFFYDLVILKQEDKFILSKVNIQDKDWDILREKFNFGEEYQHAKKSCEKTKGNWQIERDFGFPPHHCVHQKD